MSCSSLIKKLIKSNTLFGGKKIKISGIQDGANYISDATLQGFNATNKFTLSSAVPSHIEIGHYFRISSGGGANNGLLFKVLSVNGNDIFVDDSEIETSSVSDFGPGAGIVDFRLWAVIDDDTIARESTSGGHTIFNLHNVISTGLDDGSGIAENFIEHYHNDAAAASASPGFSFGKAGNLTTGTWLLRPGSVPSNKSGINVGITSPVLTKITCASENTDTYDISIYQHDGNGLNMSLITTQSVIASRKEIFTLTSNLTYNKQLAVLISNGTAKNLGIDLQLTGTNI